MSTKKKPLSTKERLSIDQVHDPKVQETARKLEQLILDYIQECQGRKRLEDNRRDSYVEELIKITGHGSTSTLSRIVKRYKTYQRDHPDKPAINSLLPNIGRPRQDKVTQKQARFIIGAYMRRRRLARLSTGKEKYIDDQPVFEEVQNLVKATFPDYNQNLEWLKRFLKKEKARKPLFFRLIRTDSVDHVYTDLLGKKVNNAPEDEEWWQSDGRKLPTPIRIEDFSCHVEIVSIMDHKSSCVLAHRLVPTKMRDSQGKVIGVGFTDHDVRMAIASAIVSCGHLAHKLYSDHGGQYEKLDLYLLSNNKDTSIHHIQSRRRSPSGRGRGERMQALLDYIAPRLPGNNTKSDSPFPRRLTKTKIAELCDLEEYSTEIAKAVEDWNKMPVGDYESRYAMWKAENKTFLPMPSALQLGLFAGFNTFEERVPLRNDGVERENTIWQNIWSDKEAYLRFSDATGTHIPFCTLILGNKLRAFGILDPTYRDHGWEEFVPKAENHVISNTKYQSYQDYARLSMVQKQRDILDDFNKTLLECFGEIPSVGVHDAQPYLRNGVPEKAQAQVESASITNDQPTPIVDAVPAEPSESPEVSPVSIPMKKATFAERLKELRENQG